MYIVRSHATRFTPAKRTHTLTSVSCSNAGQVWLTVCPTRRAVCAGPN